MSSHVSRYATCPLTGELTVDDGEGPENVGPVPWWERWAMVKVSIRGFKTSTGTHVEKHLLLTRAHSSKVMGVASG